MDLTVTGRHVQVSQRLRDRLDERLDRVSQLAPTIHRVDVVVTHERQARKSECVEVTCYGRGPVIRAEASADDKYVALDAAFDKLTERLRRVADRRRVNRGRRLSDEVAADIAPAAAAEVRHDERAAPESAFADSPIEVREKVHASVPMSLADALNEMELVGHDFFLFHDKETNKPSVVYRRRGWSYGVIHLDLVDAATSA
jgi:ribosomal subunit interface protein